MRLKTLLSRSLLVAVGLLAGAVSASAEAEWEEIVNCTFENSETLFAASSRSTVSNVKNTDLNSNVLSVATAKNATNAYGLASYDFSSLVASSATRLKVEFDYNIAATSPNYNTLFLLGQKDLLTGYAKNSYPSSGVAFSLGIVRASSKNNFRVNGTNKVQEGDADGSYSKVIGSWAHVSVALDYSSNTLSYSISSLNKETVYYEETSVAFVTSNVKCNELDLFDMSNNHTTLIDNLVISQYVDKSAATAKYTIKYVDADGATIKTSSEGEGVVGQAPTVSAADKSNFTTEDGSKRYIYVSDDAAEQTIASGDATVVTIKFREAAKYNYTITSSYNGETLPFTISGSVWEDENTVSVQYPRFQASGKTLVEKAPTNYNLTTSVTVASDGYVQDIAYSATDVTDLYLLSEAEDLETGLSTNATSFTTRVSNKMIIYGASGTLLTLPAGTYKLTIGVIGKANNDDDGTGYTVSAGEAQIITGAATGNSLSLLASEEFTLTEPTAITFTCDNAGSSRGIDMIYVQGSATGTASVTINATSHLASYSNTSAVTVPSDVVIYKAASPADGEVALTKVEGTVIPANTGVILYSATAGEKALTYGGSVTTEDYDGNVLKATGNSAYTVQSTDNIYALVKGEQAIAKVDADVVIPANKAYLEYSGSAAKLSIVFDGTTTGIGSVETTNGTNDTNAIYNLAGQRVSKSYKGVVVKGGKKFLQR